MNCLMDVKKVVHLLVPPLAFKVKKWCMTKEVELRPSLLPQIEHHSEKMIVIGNGLSLVESVMKYRDVILENDRIAIDFFAISDMYELLKPNVYLLSNPVIFDSPADLKESIEALLKKIEQVTTWRIVFIVPLSAKDSTVVARLKSNKGFIVGFYSDNNQTSVPINQFEAWDRNLSCPHCFNGINIAAYLSLFWNYKETYMIGADLSFLETIRVDQETNEICFVDEHCDENTDIYESSMDYNSRKKMSDWKLHEFIFAYSKMFECFACLRDYAGYKGLKVYNASEYSWINVFERKKLR